MTASETVPIDQASRTDWVAVAEELVPTFAARAAGHDADDTFVSENYADLRRRRVFSAAVPAELGGGGAELAEMCAVLRTLAHACSSTALALAMHTHQVLIPTWRWRHERAPVEPFLRRVATEELVKQRRLRLADRVRPRGEGRGRLSRERSQDLRQRLTSCRRVFHDGHLRRSR